MVVNTGKCQNFVIDRCNQLLKGIYKFKKHINGMRSVDFFILNAIQFVGQKLFYNNMNFHDNAATLLMKPEHQLNILSHAFDYLYLWAKKL